MLKNQLKGRDGKKVEGEKSIKLDAWDPGTEGQAEKEGREVRKA